MDSFSYFYGTPAPGQLPAQPQYQLPAQDSFLNATSLYQQNPFAGSKGQVISTRVINEPQCGVYCHDGRSKTHEHGVMQMVSAEGTVFIEHIPGYHVVFVPAHQDVDRAVGDSGLVTTTKNKKQAAPRERAAKPCNAFIMYRNHKIQEMRELKADINQTEISREAGKWWKQESDEVKEHFRAKYREEKQLYDLKKCKRQRADSTASQDDSSNKRQNTGDNLGLQTNGPVAKPRSRTLPSDAFNASQARLGAVQDLRKQAHARNVASGSYTTEHLSAGSSNYDLDLSSSPIPSGLLHPAASFLSQASSAGSVNDQLGLVELPPLVSLPEHGPPAVADYSQAAELAAAAYGSGGELANSFVSAGLAAGIPMASEEPHQEGEEEEGISSSTVVTASKEEDKEAELVADSFLNDEPVVTSS